MTSMPWALTAEQIRFPIMGVFIAIGSAYIWRNGVLWTTNKRITGTPAKIIAVIGFSIAAAFVFAGLFLSEPNAG